MTNIFAIVGPTGIGKTSLSIKLAKKLNSEIIGLDSRQIYTMIPIGTAQPSTKDLNTIKHHLIGTKDLHETVSAGEFMELVDQKIVTILDKNKTPIICGGTGLYLKSLIEGIFIGSKTDSEIRAYIEQEYDNGNSDNLYKELVSIDPVYSKKVHPNNKRRLIRALEIYKITGKNMTENFKSDNKKSAFYKNINTVYLRMSRKSLESIIQKRTLFMIDEGMIKEVQHIKDHKYNIDHIDYIGYSEILSYLDKKISLEDVIEKIHIRTRQYAKRQMKWFDNQSFDYVFDMDNTSANDIVDKLVEIN
ncbi:MAG: tRNA (adenosine(37)-N6)-dimethylallyltransferase MiaA [Candidatus Marinimicrobia bacterium]|nr:tRNA (adenosine(37)-N6)-dimethylallyltransferase MiaA [Candidatus Neomarinimicrobiota bacterium]